jgi:hypothetical protein
MINQNDAALTLVIAVGVSLVFSVVTVLVLVLRVHAEAIASREERYGLFTFIQASADLFNEYYRNHARNSHESPASPSARVASET